MQAAHFSAGDNTGRVAMGAMEGVNTASAGHFKGVVDQRAKKQNDLETEAKQKANQEALVKAVGASGTDIAGSRGSSDPSRP